MELRSTLRVIHPCHRASFFFFFHLRVADLSSSFLLFFSFNEEVAGSGTSSL